MHRYDAVNYDPPAPTAIVALRSLSGVTVSGISLLIDTGADTTLLPRIAIDRLGIIPDSALAYDLIGFDGTRSTTHHPQRDNDVTADCFHRGTFKKHDG